MLPEALVLLACTQKVGCQETSTTYYKQNIELQQMVKVVESKALTILPPLITQYGAPFLYILSGNNATIRLYGSLAFSGSLKQQSIVYNYNF